MTTKANARIDHDTARQLSAALDALQQQQPRRRGSLSRAEFVREHAKLIRALIARGFSVSQIGDALRVVEPTLSDAVIKTNARSPRRVAGSASTARDTLKQASLPGELTDS